MSKKANPTLIGGFVVGAVILLVIAVILFGGTQFFAETLRTVAYFPGSVKGLRVGSNVTLRGVRIGYVDGIQLLGDVKTLETTVQVTMQLQRNSFKLTRKGEVLAEDEEPDISIKDIIDAGLRARLGYESLVTGQLQVELDFYPETTAVYRSKAPPYPEIPSVPSAIQQVLIGLREFVEDFREKVDVDRLLADIQGTIAGANALTNSPDLEASMAGLNRLINDEDAQQLAESVQAAIRDLRGTLADTRRLVNNLDAELEPIANDLLPAIEKLDRLLDSGEKTLGAVAAQVKGETEFAHELTKTLTEVRSAARSLRIFVDYLERHPEALLRGKQPE